MKKIISSTILLVLTIISLLTATYAWYTKVDRIDNVIDVSSGYVVLDYSYDTFDTTNSTYSINNVAFFDINNVNDNFSELEYLDTMASLVKINLVNKSSCNTSVTITFTSTKLTTLDDTNTNTLSSSYIDSILLSNPLESTDKLSNHLSDSKTLSVDILKDKTTTIYMYIFGVQEIDETDIDFLSKTHNFSLTFTALKKGD